MFDPLFFSDFTFRR